MDLYTVLSESSKNNIEPVLSAINVIEQQDTYRYSDGTTHDQSTYIYKFVTDLINTMKTHEEIEDEILRKNACEETQSKMDNLVTALENLSMVWETHAPFIHKTVHVIRTNFPQIVLIHMLDNDIKLARLYEMYNKRLCDMRSFFCCGDDTEYKKMGNTVNNRRTFAYKISHIVLEHLYKVKKQVSSIYNPLPDYHPVYTHNDNLRRVYKENVEPILSQMSDLFLYVNTFNFSRYNMKQVEQSDMSLQNIILYCLSVPYTCNSDSLIYNNMGGDTFITDCCWHKQAYRVFAEDFSEKIKIFCEYISSHLPHIVKYYKNDCISVFNDDVPEYRAMIYFHNKRTPGPVRFPVTLSAKYLKSEYESYQCPDLTPEQLHMKPVDRIHIDPEKEYITRPIEIHDYWSSTNSYEFINDEVVTEFHNDATRIFDYIRIQRDKIEQACTLPLDINSAKYSLYTSLFDVEALTLKYLTEI